MRVLSLFLALGLCSSFSGCAQITTVPVQRSASIAADESVTLNLTIRARAEKTLKMSRKVSRGSNAMEILKQVVAIESVEHPPQGGSVKSLMGIGASTDEEWVLSINSHLSCYPITKIVIDQDMSMLWELQKRTSSHPSPIVLHGTVVTVGTVLKDGYVIVESCWIRSIESALPSGVPVIETDGLIFPGFVDIHNHASWNIFNAWPIPAQGYQNRYEWITRDDAYRTEVNGVRKKLIEKSASKPGEKAEKNQETVCEIGEYGEVKALMGGTTSLQGNFSDLCIRGLVRNIDQQPFLNQAQSVKAIVFLNCNIVGLPCETDEQLRTLTEEIRNGKIRAVLIHLAEGIDGQSRDEFKLLGPKGLLGNATILIHGVALTQDEFQEMAKYNMKLVWSPRSNRVLYKTGTTKVKIAKDIGLEIALAPDWSISGSDNILQELKVAAEENKRDSLGLSDQELVEMVTVKAATMLGMEDKIGSLAPGHYADLLIIRGNHLDLDNPYRSLIEATEKDISLVMVDGEPLYGDRSLLSQLGKPDYETITVCGVEKGLNIRRPDLPFANQVYSEIDKHLNGKMAAHRATLAPLVRCEAN